MAPFRATSEPVDAGRPRTRDLLASVHSSAIKKAGKMFQPKGNHQTSRSSNKSPPKPTNTPPQLPALAFDETPLAPVHEELLDGTGDFQPASTAVPPRGFVGAGTAEDPIDLDALSGTSTHDSVVNFDDNSHPDEWDELDDLEALNTAVYDGSDVHESGEVAEDGARVNEDLPSPDHDNAFLSASRSRSPSLEIISERLVERETSVASSKDAEVNNGNADNDDNEPSLDRDKPAIAKEPFSQLEYSGPGYLRANQHFSGANLDATADRKSTVADIMPGESAFTPPRTWVPSRAQSEYLTSSGSSSGSKRKRFEQEDADDDKEEESWEEVHQYKRCRFSTYYIQGEVTLAEAEVDDFKKWLDDVGMFAGIFRDIDNPTSC
ncbi:MAG: hypothetical protein M1831_004744 [Alyxoria varia]|nr:MAG: hypothetical protein M1831_004744 [Alyxoria varia]